MPKPEAMSAETFDEDSYRDELIDKEGYSVETAKMKAKKKKESFANIATKIEIDLGSLAKSKKKVWVKPTAQKKGHYREMEVGRKEKLSREEKRAIYSEAFEVGLKHKELGMDCRQDDKYLHPKSEKAGIQSLGYVDGWAEGYEEEDE